MKGTLIPFLRYWMDIFPIVRNNNSDIDNKVLTLLKEPYSPSYYFNLPACCVEEHQITAKTQFEHQYIGVIQHANIPDEEQKVVFDLYDEVREEKCFRDYAEEKASSKKSIDQIAHVIQEELVKSQGRINKISTDLQTSLHFLKEFYELDTNYIPSMWNCALILLMASCDPNEQYLNVQQAMASTSHALQFHVYCFFLILVGIPLSLAELTLSRYGNSGQLGAWKPFMNFSWAMILINSMAITAAATSLWTCTFGLSLAIFNLIPRVSISCTHLLYAQNTDDSGKKLICYDKAENSSRDFVCREFGSLEMFSFTSEGFPTQLYITIMYFIATPKIETSKIHRTLAYLGSLLCWCIYIKFLNTDMTKVVKAMSTLVMTSVFFYFFSCLIFYSTGGKDLFNCFSIVKQYMRPFENGFNYTTLLHRALLRALSNQLFFTTVLGPYLPRRSNILKILIIKTALLIFLEYAVLFISYASVYSDMAYLQTSRAKCFVDSFHIMYSSIPRYFLVRASKFFSPYFLILVFMIIKIDFFYLKVSLNELTKFKLVKNNYMFVVIFFCIAAATMTLIILNKLEYYYIYMYFQKNIYLFKSIVTVLGTLIFHLCIIFKYGLTRLFDDFEFLNYYGQRPMIIIKWMYYMAICTIIMVQACSLSNFLFELGQSNNVAIWLSLLVIIVPLTIASLVICQPHRKKIEVSTIHGIEYFSTWGNNSYENKMRRKDFSPRFFDKIENMKLYCRQEDNCLRCKLSMSHSQDRDLAVKAIALLNADRTIRNYSLSTYH